MTADASQRPAAPFVARHLGPRDTDIGEMLAEVGKSSMEALVATTVPESIQVRTPIDLPAARDEHQLLADLRQRFASNRVLRSYIGQGYHGTLTPGVILRNVLENPGWYTQYTPYQAEIAQGRLEALLNFQTMVSDLTGLPLSNASLLDEATAAAEAMTMCVNLARGKRRRFLVDRATHPQTIAVLQTRAEPQDIAVEVIDAIDSPVVGSDVCGVLLSYPATDGAIIDPTDFAAKVHEAGALVVMATDLLALTLLKPPGEVGADIAIGSSQRFGVPMGLGGPHAAFIATKDAHKRQIPGRIVGLSKDATGKPALRLALQTREQHIRRDRATSNICTAQVLLAIVASFYGVYHGPQGLERIARDIHEHTTALARGLEKLGLKASRGAFFDTLCVTGLGSRKDTVLAAALERGINLRNHDATSGGSDDAIGIAFDETVRDADVLDVLAAFDLDGKLTSGPGLLAELRADGAQLPPDLARSSPYMTHSVFHSHRSEHEILRYLKRLENRDLSLTTSMIPLGSCTMKLNATAEMAAVTWPEVGNVHPFAPRDQWAGYTALFEELEAWLAEITGFSDVSLQPNSGAQGEYAGLLVIRAAQQGRGQAHRNICLIPVSAHGTNPASAVMAGYKVVSVACDDDGNIDVADLEAKAKQHEAALAAIMLTYPSTHGVFEDTVETVCEVVHRHGGLVYLDGANMNAQVGVCRPGDYGADVCHLNLHKTFCIPHGGGGPGMGPIGVTAELAPYLPGHPSVPGVGGDKAIGPISAAPYGSPSILPISWAYIAMMGGEGLRKATQVAILNANYMAKRLAGHYPILYTGREGLVAHEFIIDVRPLKKSAGIDPDDIAKRLMDYGFHAPTMSWPVAGTLMVEPTESEPRAELDRFCDAMIAIREEARLIEEGKSDPKDNPLKYAPHTAEVVTASEWGRSYSRETAAFPAPWTRECKYWPTVSRIDNALGDRNLVCTCPSVEELSE